MTKSDVVGWVIVIVTAVLLLLAWTGHIHLP
jgi:hypothetical protein